MAGAAAGPRDVGDLVLLQSRIRQPLHRLQVHRRRILVGRLGPAGAGHVFLQRRIRVHLKEIERQMIRMQRDCAVDGPQPVGHPLLRQPHHQIDAEIVEAGGAGLRDRLARAIGGMQPR